MKKIAYISRVWGSLEDSYAGYLKKCPDLSRIDYLKLLVSYNPDNSGAVFLPLFLSDELGEYTEEELKEYDGLVEVMNRVHDALGKVTEIDNLQEFVYGAFIKENDNNVPDIKDFEFFTKGEYCTAMQLLKTGNFANSVVTGAVNKAYVLNPSDPDMMQLGNIYDMMDFLEKPGELDQFRLIAYATLVKMYISKQQMIYPMVFIGSNLYSVEGTEIVIDCTGQRITYTAKNCIDEDITINLGEEQKTVHINVIWRNIKTMFGTQKLIFVR